MIFVSLNKTSETEYQASMGYINEELRDAFGLGFKSLDSSACMPKTAYELLERERQQLPNQALVLVNHLNTD